MDPIALQFDGYPSPRYGEETFVSGYGSFAAGDVGHFDSDTAEWLRATKIWSDPAPAVEPAPAAPAAPAPVAVATADPAPSSPAPTPTTTS